MSNKVKEGIGKLKFRSKLHILGMIITICIVLSMICISFGIHFSNKFSHSLDNTKSILPFVLIFMGIIITFFWGISIMYLGITTYFIKQKTVGTINRSEIRSYYDSDEGNIYYIYSWIYYTINNYKYENEGKHDFSTVNEIEIKQKLLEFKIGNEIIIYYDCKNPYSISLDNKNDKVWSEILGGIGFILFGFFLSIVLGTLLG